MSKANQYNLKKLYFSDRISEAIDGIFRHPLSIIEAPMGYGKTTVVMEYLNKSGSNILWQRVFDTSLDNFWKGFSRLFRDLDDNCYQSLVQLGFPNDNVSAQEALNLIEEIDLPPKTVLVIDDYHFIDSSSVNNFIEILVENEIENLHIILIVRYLKFQKLEELMLKGYLHHINQELLELNPKEIGEYYKLCGITLNDSETEYLYSMTEGWISALYLLMLEYVTNRRITPEKNIYRLIENAVYLPLSADVQDFMLTMCIFDSFTYNQSFHMWGKENTGKLIAEIINKNAFVKYDDTTKTYQMHSIFTGFLKEVLELKDTQYKHQLYQKAAHWHLKSGEYFAARHYFYACQDFDNVLVTLEEDSANSYTDDTKEFLIQLMDECPREVKLRHPSALLKYAMHLFVHNEPKQFAAVCEEFRNNIDTDKSLNESTRNRLLGELELMLSFTAYNDINKMATYHRKAWELLDRPTSIVSNKSNWTFGSPSILYMFYRESGKLEEHVKDLQENLHYYSDLTNGQGSGAEYVMEAEMYFNMGDFDNAEIVVHKALIKAQTKMQTSIALCAIFLQIRMLFMRGNFSKMLELLNQMREDMKNKRQYHFIYTVEICEGLIYASLNQINKIPNSLVEADLGNLRLRFPVHAMFNIMYGRVLLIKGEYLKLIGIAEHFLTVASVFPNLLGIIYTHIYLAAAYKQLFRDSEALSSLKKALEIAIPDKQYMPFVENCDSIKSLLEKIMAEGGYRGRIERILELYKDYGKLTEKFQEHFTQEKPRLSRREEEIAHLAAAGFTNAEIGKKLFISSNTVKMAIKSIYTKLSINNRTLLKQYLNNPNQ